MTFAVIKTGGKQYKVAEGDVLRVEKLETKSDEVVFDDVLLVVNGEVKLGKPVVSGAKVTAKIIEEGKIVEDILNDNGIFPKSISELIGIRL